MPYPNDNKLNVIIAQTSASADLTAKYPFTERIISGSNLVLLTDSSGVLQGSNTIPNLTITDLTVTTLTASIISASTALTSAAATFTGPVSMSSTLTASGIYDSGILTVIGVTNLSNVTASNMLFSGAPSYLNGTNLIISASGANFTGNLGSNTLTVSSSIVDGGSLTVLGNTFLGDTLTDTVKVTGSVSISGSLSVVGPIIGTVETASKIIVTNLPNNNATYYVTFVENTGSAQSILTDSNVLSYNPNTNTVKIGDTSGSLLISNDNGTNLNYISLFNDPSSTGGATIQIGQPASNQTASLYVGSNSYGFRVLTGQGINTGVITELPMSASNKVLFSNTTNATSWVNGGSLTVAGGTAIGKDLYVSGSTFLYGDLTIYGSSSIVNISSSTVIIGDNRILLNAGNPIIRYAGIDVYDSGSGGIQSNVTSSFLWDSLTDNWIIFSANSSSGTFTTASSIMIGGPVSKFGSESSLTANYFPKAQSSGKNLTDSLLSENGSTLSYQGNISASQITASAAWLINLSSSFVTSSVATIANIYSNAISSSQITASNALLTNVFSVNVSSSFVTASNAQLTNVYSVNISSSQITASNALLTNVYSFNVSSSFISASNAQLTNVYSNYISSSAITSSIATISTIYSTKISSSQITASDAYFLNLGIDNLSASRITASNAWIVNISSSRITASGATISNIYSTYISSSVISSSNLRVELTGSITYATGVLVTYVTGSFNVLTLSTGSYPGNAPGLVPNTPTSSGMPGQINIDNNFIYVYTNQIWKRVPLSQWLN